MDLYSIQCDTDYRRRMIAAKKRERIINIILYAAPFVFTLLIVIGFSVASV